MRLSITAAIVGTVFMVPGVVPGAMATDAPAAHAEHPAKGLFRSIDGTGNNPIRPELNAPGTHLMRRMHEAYADGVAQMGGASRPGARHVSNVVVAQGGPIPNSANASGYLWQWGQFLDHDLDFTDIAVPAEPAHIPVPTGDPFFDPAWTGTQVIPFHRSRYDATTGTGAANPRQQVNLITGWFDASHIYGSDGTRAAALRAHDGTGRLKTSAGALLPFNVGGLPNQGGTGARLFLAGDVRANEQVGLTALHTLFVREHNRLADEIASRQPWLDDEAIYQRARRIVGAEMQVITYREFLPALLGPDALEPYRGYRPATDARIMNEFSAAAFRLGHSLLSPELKRLDSEGKPITAGHLKLRDAFFAPEEIINHGIEPILRGLAWQVCQELDVHVIDDVRNFLFGRPGHGGLDLAAINIQRGRDHGLPGYNDAREHMGLAPARTFADVSSRPQIQARLASAYATPDEIDLWVGGLAEDHLPGALVGELFHSILKSQFEASRNGDRFWYARILTGPERRLVEQTSLADVIRRNTSIRSEIPDDVFHVGRAKSEP